MNRDTIGTTVIGLCETIKNRIELLQKKCLTVFNDVVHEYSRLI